MGSVNNLFDPSDLFSGPLGRSRLSASSASPSPSPSPSATATSTQQTHSSEQSTRGCQASHRSRTDQLHSAVLAEQKRHGRKPSGSNGIARKHHAQEIAPPLTQGKLNAVRAAFKAGVTPPRIARQFGITHSQVRKALATNGPKSMKGLVAGGFPENLE